ncbi:N-hydroxyarylamine O-acetyltransferase [Thermosporothrix hazakensis]|jgi:N-hydroxyarylamine O-acetyltransferase|uniref:N-hydroxyarylamine O-acetyltransferase n=1 Tax=Thermosporothrix hazakensis TaxID=644383 RepID=A0A326U9T0_THEHA|nr:arylamine N-acetyltransferase [Thermosporothrix hazakensis]PZW32841.1 N-hydroxyarylamine O-acetyltransferase [Thermosporothrix hazakensis]GCE48872.1 acetyltransferase [Thermosporothrix hazakensis]
MSLDITAYCQRIGYTGSLEPTTAVLRELHRKHLETVPFENLDIHIKRPIVLDETALYQKIVQQQRGGFCYELNGLFAQLLSTLGFEVDRLSAGVSNGEGSFGPDFDHMLLRVRCVDSPEDWLADVGFGDCFLEPLRFVLDEEQEQANGSYRIEQGETPYYVLYRRPLGKDWNIEHRFTLEPQPLEAFNEMCQYQQTSPQSHFTQRAVCSRVTPDGRITLRDDRLIVTRGTERIEYSIADRNAYHQALLQHFGISLPTA